MQPNDVETSLLHRGALLLPALLCALATAIAAGCGDRQPADDRTGQVPLRIITQPAGAEVFLDEESVGQSPLEIEVDSRQPHVLRFSLSGHEESWHPLPAGSEEHLIDITLRPITAPVYIVSRPPGALVRVDDVDRGAAPVAIPALGLGEHTVIFSRTGYADSRATFEIAGPRPVNLVHELESVMGTLRVVVTPNEADILLDGKRQSGARPLELNLPAGDYLVEATCPGYRPDSRRVVLMRNETKRIELQLPPLPGSVMVTSDPPGATVFNAATNEALGVTPLRLENLPDGELALRIEKAGHDPATQTVNVSHGLVKAVTATLRSNTGGLIFNTEPPGVKVFIDGQERGETKAADTPLVSALFEVTGLAIGPHQLQLVKPRHTPRTVSFFIERGKTERLGTLKLTALWIPTHVLKLTNNKVYNGILVQTFPDGSIDFERSPRVKVTYRAEEVASIKKLEVDPEE